MQKQERATIQRLAHSLRLGRGSQELRSPYGQAIIFLGSDFSAPDDALASARLAGRLACRLANRLCADSLEAAPRFNEGDWVSASRALEALWAGAIYRDHVSRYHPALKSFEATLAPAHDWTHEQTSVRLSAHFISLLTLLPHMEQKEFMQEAWARAELENTGAASEYRHVVTLVQRRLVHTVIQTSSDDYALRALFDGGLSPLLAQGTHGLTQLLARPQCPQLLYLNGLSVGYGQEVQHLTQNAPLSAQALTNLLGQNHTLIVMGLGPYEAACAALEDALASIRLNSSTSNVFWFSAVPRARYSERLNDLIVRNQVHWIDAQDWTTSLESLHAALNGKSHKTEYYPSDEDKAPPAKMVSSSSGMYKKFEDPPAQSLESEADAANASTAFAYKPRVESETDNKHSNSQSLAPTDELGEAEKPTASHVVMGIPSELDLDFPLTQEENTSSQLPLAPLPPMGLRIQASSSSPKSDLEPEPSPKPITLDEVNTVVAAGPAEMERALQHSHEWEMQADSTRFDGQEARSAEILQRAVQLYQMAVDALPETTPSTELSRLYKKLGETYFLLCGSSHNAEHLESAVSAYRRSMDFSNKQKSPYVWSDTQHKLGLALASLGELTSDSGKVREAVAAYEAALEVRTLQETPADWACTKNFLGIALSTLGAQESHVDTLVQAVAAYQSALLGYSKDADTVDWAGVQNNLGAALANLGERTGEAQYLERATQAFESALSVISKDAMPQDWVMTQSNLAHALAGLGKHSAHVDALGKAIKAYEKVLEVRQRDHDPLDWAMTQNNLGHVLHSYSEQSNNAEMAFRAVQAFRDTLKAISRDEYPLDWAATQNNLGNALQSLSEQTNDIESLRKAIDAYEAALEVRKEDLHPLEWAGTQGNLAHALQTLSDKTQDDNLLRRTIIAYKSALGKIDAKSMPINWTVLQNNLGTALRILGERQGSSELLKASIAAYTAAQPFFESAGVGPYVDMVRKNLDLARASLSKIKS